LVELIIYKTCFTFCLFFK